LLKIKFGYSIIHLEIVKWDFSSAINIRTYLKFDSKKTIKQGREVHVKNKNRKLFKNTFFTGLIDVLTSFCLTAEGMCGFLA